MKGLSPRFFWWWGLALLAACAAYSAWVLGSTSWADAQELDRIFPFYNWRSRAFSATAYAAVRNGLGLAAGLLAITAAVMALSERNRTEISALGREMAQAQTGLRRGIWQLNSGQRWQLLGALAGLTLLRLYFSIYNPEYDDAVSYEVFVSKGLLATSAYYPIPNNHVFSNTISLLFYQLSPGFWWSMRLPVLLVSTGATVFLFAALLRHAGFRAAAVAVTLFSCLQLSLYHAGVGRGYWLLILFGGVVFFCTLELAAGPRRPRAAWAGLAVAGVLGCYTVPTFVYALASAFSWLGLAYLRRRQWAQLGQLAAVGILVGVATTVLYTPLLLVSGFDKLTGNGFVAALEPGRFWRELPAYLWHNEGFLAGQRSLGPLITLAVLALLGRLFHLARTGRLPAAQAQRLRQLAPPALWFMALPYTIILGQRVFPPERVLLYKAFFFFILAALVMEWLLGQWPGRRWPRRTIAALAVLFGVYQTYSVVRVNPAARGTNAAYHAGLRWLVAQPPGPVLVPEPTHNLFFRFYAHSEERQRTWQIDDDQHPGTQYAYVVAFPNKRGFFQPLFPFPPVYRNAQLDIYAVPPNYPLRTKPWRH